VQEKIQPTERALQPTVSAFECGGAGIKSTIETCHARGGDYRHCAMDASRAGVSDATACYTYASAIHARREQLVGAEDQLDAQIRYLQDVNHDTEVLNTELSDRVQQATAMTDMAVASQAQGDTTRADLAQLGAILDHEVSAARRQVDAASHELEVARQYRSRQSPSTAAALDAEIKRLQALLDEAQRQTRALLAQRQRF
jgi:hypothetical protein